MRKALAPAATLCFALISHVAPCHRSVDQRTRNGTCSVASPGAPGCHDNRVGRQRFPCHFFGTGTTVEVVAGNNEPSVKVRGYEGGVVGFSIPHANSRDSSLADGRLVVDGEDGTTPSYVLSSRETGGTIAAVIPSPESPTELSYSPLAGTRIELDSSTGNVLLYDAGSASTETELLGIAHAPWAVDAAGRHVPTHFEIRQGNLIQVVDHTSANYQYPIVADPSWDEIKSMMAKLEERYGRGQNGCWGKVKYSLEEQPLAHWCCAQWVVAGRGTGPTRMGGFGSATQSRGA
ncbi:hypothetical protein SAMN04488539_0899 [Corynebacterium timonense]|uniref:Uncharacterized protein n=1 Tax=Corynebacterium timonense TaxID=441500 RepID=A0A1H1P0D7_9CORY|nr:hypothetical protein SAMN04488539_0899 [Corynebacterium timonense]